MWDIENLRGVQKKLVTGSSEMKKKKSFINDIMLRMDGFEKWQMKFKVVYSTKM